MAVIVLAALGVPLWLVVGALAAGIWSRRSFKHAPGVFPAKVRVTAGEVPGLETSWPRRCVYARWVHDVLLVPRGIALVRNAAFGVAQVTGPVRSGEPRSISGLEPCRSWWRSFSTAVQRWRSVRNLRPRPGSARGSPTDLGARPATPICVHPPLSDARSPI